MTFGFKLGLILLALTMIGCASRESGWSQQGEQVALSEGEQRALKREAQLRWSKRGQQEDLEEALAKFELLHAAQPGDIETLIYLTRGHYLLADAHLDNDDLKMNHFEKATSFGEKAMATNEAFRDSVSKGKSVEESLGTLTVKEVPALYWSAAALGKWAKAKGIATQLKFKTRIKAQIERVERLQPDYFYGAPDRFWGGYFAVAPTFAGGDLNKSKAHFEKSLKIAPEYLGTKVLMAELYYTKKGDKKAFESTLQEVLASTADKHKDLGPENLLEKKKAERLLEQTGDLF